MQFYCGLEGSPGQWAGWTLSGVAACGHHLYLSGGGQNDLSSLANWTTASGTPPAVEGARFKVTAVGEARNLTDILPNGNFDLRFEWDIPVSNWDGNGTNGNLTNEIGVYLNDTSHRAAAYIQSPTMSSGFGLIVTGVAGTPGIGCPADVRYGTYRLTRAGNVFTSYYLDPFTGAWVQTGTGTNAQATNVVSTYVKCIADGSPVQYWSNLRNAVPTVTTGTATSPVLDTEHGFRGLGWYLTAGTGTVMVEYRTGATSGECSAASYQSATNWSAVTPSAANRYVQVRVTFSGGSTTAASPEIGPILVNGSLSQANARLLFQRMAVAHCRHTNSLNQICVGEPGSKQNATWARAMLGVARWVNANARNLTFEGTTWDLGNYAVQGTYTNLADATNGQGESVQVCAAYTGLTGLAVGWGVLGSILTGAQKTNLTTAVNGTINNVFGTNWNTFAMINRMALTSLYNADTPHVSGRWDNGSGTPYADSDSETYWAALQSGLLGQGAYQDVAGHNDDIYSNSIGLVLGFVLEVNPGYTHAADVQDAVRQIDRSYRVVTDTDGLAASHGRSFGSHVWLEGPQLSIQSALYASGRTDTARELASRAVWSLLRNAYEFGLDALMKMPARTGNSAVAEGYLSHSMTTGETITALGYYATATALYAAAPAAYPGSQAGPGVWVAPAAAVCLGDAANDPQVQVHGSSWDGDAYSSKYMCTRPLAQHFGQNTGEGSANIPCQRGAGFFYHDSSLSAGNVVYLANPTTVKAFLGGRGAFVWRSGVPDQWSPTVNRGAATGCAVAELYYLRGRHCVLLAKVALAADGRAMSSFGVASPPIPLADGDALNNAATTTTRAYAEAPASYPETLSACITGLSPTLQGSGVPRAGTFFLAAASLKNRYNYGGLGVELYDTGSSLSGTQYFAADLALSRGAMVAADESAWAGSYSRSGDVVTFTADSQGTPESVYAALVAQNLSGQAVGLYSVTGSAVRAFAGKAAAADWFGGSDLTAVSFGGAAQASLASAGNLAVHKTSALNTRVWADQAVTLQAACLPPRSCRVLAYDVSDQPVDVTSSCTLTPGVSAVIPAGVVTGYKFGVARFDVQGLVGRSVIGE